MTLSILLCVVLFLYGIVIGSFVNVCIYRIPAGEDIVKTRSHCMNCGYQLKWYDLIPLFSYLCLGGKCRKCGQKISVQYPIIEALNGGLYVLIYIVCGWSVETLLYCLLSSALVALSVIDERTGEIPPGINLFILALGLIRVVTDLTDWLDYGIGLICVSLFLYLILLLSKGRAIGGGDVKLMAVCGLLLGWKRIILALALACIIGSIVHLTRMKVAKAGHELHMGPYLSAGVLLAALWGDQMLQWYFGLFGLAI